MSNSKFLEEHGLERSLPTKEAKAFEKLLKIANQSYVLNYRKKKQFKVGRLQYWYFYVHCPVRNFADAYTHVGLLWAKTVLPIWNERFETKSKKRK